MASLLNIATSGLLTYQRALSVTGHNIANADTEGYSRQTVEFETREPTLSSQGWTGSGVRVGNIQRHYDDLLAKQIRSSQSAASRTETIYTHASRIDNIIASTDVGLDPAIQSFFESLQGVVDEPTSVAARQVALFDAQAMADRFKYVSRQYDDLRTEVNQQLGNAAQSVTALAESIAHVNEQIQKAVGVTGGGAPPDLLDKQEHLINQLSEKVDLTVVFQEDFSANVFIGNGQALVVGTRSASLELQQNPANPATPDLVIRSGPGVELVSSLIDSGEIGGLLDFREGFLDEGQNQLGLIALGISEKLNAQHQLGQDLYGNMGGPLFADLSFQGLVNANNVGTGAVGITFDAANIADLTTSDYTLEFNGGTSYTLTRHSDRTQTAIDTSLPVPTIDGFDLAITTGTLQPGDSFLIRPTHFAARDMDLIVSDPNRIAAGGTIRAAEATTATGNPLNTGDASISGLNTASTTGIPLAADMTLTFSNDADSLGNAGFVIANGPAAPNDYVLYDPTSSDVYGVSFPGSGNPSQFSAFGDISFQIAGTPAVGDQFVISNNTNGVSDNRNAMALADLQNVDLLYGGAATFQSTYSQLVSDVGSQTRYAEINFNAQEGLLQTQKEALSSVAGVNLDEEAANLIKYQQAYQATAQVVSVANTLFDTLIGAVRR